MSRQRDLVQEIEALRRRLSEAEQALGAIRAAESRDLAPSDANGRERPAPDGLDSFHRRLLEQMREGSVEIGSGCVILHCNRQFREMIGKPADELAGICILDYVAPKHASLFADFIRAPETANREFEFRRADGAPFPVSIALSGSTRETDASRLVVVTDLTQLKWMERVFVVGEALREREKWLRLAVAAGRVGTFDIDLFTGVAQFSVTMRELLGLAPDVEITLAESAAMALEDDKTQLEAKFRAACDPAGDGEWSHETRIRRGDGAIRWIAVAGQVKFRHTPDGRVAARYIGAAIDVTDRKEMEDSLRRSNERLRLALSAGALGSWEFDVAARVTYFDQKCREAYGFELDTPITPERVFSIIAPEDVSFVRQAFEAALDPTGDGRYQTEYRIRRQQDGQERWMASRARAIFENGRAIRLIGVASDITDKKTAERDLYEKAKLAEQLACVAASVPGLIASFRLDSGGRLSLPYASPNLEEVYGTPAHMLREDAAPVLARIHADDRHQVEASIAESARTMTLCRGCYRFDHPRKGWIWIEAHSAPTREADGSILWHGYYQDVTERKRTEEALVAKEARLHATVEGAHDAIITIDEQGAMQSLNSAALRMFGYTLAETIGQDVDMLMSTGDSKAHRRCAVDRLPMRGSANLGKIRESEGRRKDGSLFPVDLTISETSYHGRRLLIGFVRDLSGQRRIEERVQKLHAERLDAMGELATGLAHELNQPLSATAIYLKAARRLLQMPPELRPANVEDTLDNATAQIIRAGRIIGHLREFIARGEPDKTIQNLHDLINEANELVIVEAKQTDIQVVLQLNAKNDRIVADKVQIKQVVVNLMRNAKDAMNGSRMRKMIISTSSVGKTMIKVDIADTGCGLAEETRGCLFEPFTTTKGNGMGVGLSISRSIVEAHYGTIWAGPNRDGGATFSFTLPLTEMEAVR